MTIEAHHRQTAIAQLHAAREALGRAESVLNSATGFQQPIYPTPEWRQAVEAAYLAAEKAQVTLAKLALR